MDTNSNSSPTNGTNRPAGKDKPAQTAANKKTIIIVAFLVAFAGLASIFGPLMVSSCALMNAGFDISMHDNVAAREHLNLALKMDPHSSAAYKYSGELAAQMKQADQALADYTQALKYGGGIDCNLSRGIQNHMMGRLPKALEDYRVVLEKQPKNLNALVNQSDAYYRLDDVKKSLETCNKAVAVDPKDATSLLNRAQCYLRMQRWKAAITDVSAALDNVYRTGTNPDIKRDCYVMRATASRALEDTESAESDIADARRAAHVHHSTTSEARLMEPDFSQKTVNKNFILCSDLAQPEASALAERLQSFLKFIDANVCHVRADKNFRIFIFDDKAKYDENLADKKLTPEPNSNEAKYSGRSFYDTSRNCIYTYGPAPADLGTIVSSLMQKVVEDLPFGDKWTKDGLAAVIAKSYGYIDKNSCQMYLAEGFHGYALPENVPSLSEVINDERHDQDFATAQLVPLFEVKNGRIQHYLSLAQSGLLGDYATFTEAAFAKRTAQIEQDWKSFVDEIRKSGPNSGQTSGGKFFSSKKDFDAFAAANPALKLVAITFKEIGAKEKRSQ